jgi:Zinc dependent phospholipase C
MQARVVRAVAAVAGCTAAALVLVALLPSTAHAWTPGTHVFLGEAVLRTLDLIPAAVADLLRAFPYDFLYGSIAADTSIAKKYAPVGRHCHSWNVGLEIADRAADEPLRAFALGYQAHLAADAVAHNYFVPRQLAITASTASLGHSYWESRFETHLGDRCSRRARELIMLDHSRSDDHLDRILSPTIFSTPTNRRIFRGMVHVADSESWQRIFSLMTENSRWDLPDDEVERQLMRSFDFVIDWLRRGEASEPYRLDPSGDEPLTIAKRVRRSALRRGGETLARDEAERRFGLPPSSLHFAATLPTPLFPPSRRGAGV